MGKEPNLTRKSVPLQYIKYSLGSMNVSAAFMSDVLQGKNDENVQVQRNNRREYLNISSTRFFLVCTMYIVHNSRV